MIISVYLHASKESCANAGQQAGLSEEAIGMFCYAGNEHKADYDVDPNTGKATLVAVDGVRLEAAWHVVARFKHDGRMATECWCDCFEQAKAISECIEDAYATRDMAITITPTQRRTT